MPAIQSPGPSKPRVSVPVVVKKLPPLPLSEDHKVGYYFFKDRWEGEEFKPHATAVAQHFNRQGYNCAVYTGDDKEWKMGKQTPYEYYKVFILHPTEKGLYTWWIPTVEEWSQPLDLAYATWFELESAKKEDK